MLRKTTYKCVHADYRGVYSVFVSVCKKCSLPFSPTARLSGATWRGWSRGETIKAVFCLCLPVPHVNIALSQRRSHNCPPALRWTLTCTDETVAQAPAPAQTTCSHVGESISVKLEAAVRYSGIDRSSDRESDPFSPSPVSKKCQSMDRGLRGCSGSSVSGHQSAHVQQTSRTVLMRWQQPCFPSIKRRSNLIIAPMGYLKWVCGFLSLHLWHACGSVALVEQ